MGVESEIESVVMKTAAVLVLLVGLVTAETRSNDRQKSRRGRQYDNQVQYYQPQEYSKQQQENQQQQYLYNPVDKTFQPIANEKGYQQEIVYQQVPYDKSYQQENVYQQPYDKTYQQENVYQQQVPYEKVQQHHHGSPQQVQYESPEVEITPSKEIYVPNYEYESYTPDQKLPLDPFHQDGSYDFQYSGYGNKVTSPPVNVQYVPQAPAGTPPTALKFLPIPTKQIFPKDPNPFPVPARFQFGSKNVLIAPTKTAPPPPPAQAPKPTSFKIDLLQPILRSSQPPPAAPQYRIQNQPQYYYQPQTTPKPKPPPTTKAPSSPFSFFLNILKNFRLS